MPVSLFPDYNALPGIQAALLNTEGQIWWGRIEQQVVVSGVIISTAADSTQSPTNYLRPGTLLSRIRSSGKLSHWVAPQATDGAAAEAEDGTDMIYGVLLQEQQMDQAGTNVDRWHGQILVSGNVKAQALVISGTSSAGIDGHAQEYLIRAQMSARFLFDDDVAAADSNVIGGSSAGFGWRNIVARGLTGGADGYTVLEADNNTLFHTVGSGGLVTFTLPATAKKGLRYGFASTSATGLAVVAGTADTLITLNDLAADSVTFATASEIIGGFLEVVGLGGATNGLWLVIPHLWEAQTVTIAT